MRAPKSTVGSDPARAIGLVAQVRRAMITISG
jgi:hypothetical protein